MPKGSFVTSSNQSVVFLEDSVEGEWQTRSTSIYWQPPELFSTLVSSDFNSDFVPPPDIDVGIGATVGRGLVGWNAEFAFNPLTQQTKVNVSGASRGAELSVELVFDEEGNLESHEFFAGAGVIIGNRVDTFGIVRGSSIDAGLGLYFSPDGIDFGGGIKGRVGLFFGEIVLNAEHRIDVIDYDRDGCFDQSVAILMADGSIKPIFEIQVDDTVLSFDETGNLVPGRVTRLLYNVTDEWFRLSNGTLVTPGHRFLQPDGSFKEIGAALAEGGGTASIVLAGGSVASVTAERILYSSETAHLFEEAEVIALPADGNAALAPSAVRGWKTYNFTVERTHTYIADGIRVHNDSILNHVDWDLGVTQVIDFDPDNPNYAKYRLEDGAVVEVYGEDANGEPGTDLLRRRVEYETDGVVVDLTEHLDGDDNVTDVEIDQFTIRGVPYGEIVGQALGRHAAATIDIDNFLLDAGVDALVATVIENIGEFIEVSIRAGNLSAINLNGRLLGSFAEGVLTGDVDNGSGDLDDPNYDPNDDSFGEEFEAYLTSTLASAAVTAFLDAIELDGLAGEVVGSIGTSLGSQLISESFDVVFDGLDFGDIGPGFDGSFDLDAIEFNPASIVASFAASRAAGALVEAESQEAAILGSVGSVIAGKVLGNSIGSFLLGTTALAGPIGFAIGAFIGQIGGTLLGNLFGGHKDPTASATIHLGPSGGEYGLGSLESDDGGDVNIAKQMAYAAYSGVNNIIEISGGVMRQTSSYSLKIGYENSTYFVVLNGNRKNFDNSGEAIKFAALKLLQGADIVGGHAVVMRAWHSSEANTLEAFQEDLLVAEAFQTYLLNPTGVVALMLEAPESEASQQWAAILQRAEEMKLHLPHEKDFDGGWGELLTARGNINPEAIPEIDGSTITMTDPITGDVITIHHAIGPGYEIVRTETTDGNDTIKLTLDADQISYTNAGPGDDSFVGHNGVDIFVGGDGNDTADGGEGNDWLLGNDGDDSLFGNAGDDLLVGNAGNDVLEGGDGVDKAYGGAGDDLIMGNNDTDFLYGGTGDDEIHGNAGREDRLWGGDGDDELYLQDGDTAYGGLGNDVVYMGSGNNTFSVGRLDGHDVVRKQSSSGVDQIYFGKDLSFNEMFFQRFGSDLKISIIGRDQSVTIESFFAGRSTHLYLNNGQLFLNKDGGVVATAQALVDAHAALPGTIQGQYNLISDSALAHFDQFLTVPHSWYFHDTQVNYNTKYFTKSTEAGNFWGNPNFRTQGNDTYTFRNAKDWVKYQVYAGAGNDTIKPSTNDDLGTTFVVFGDSGDDTLNDTNRTGYLYGGIGVDVLKGNYGDDVLNGGHGDDSLFGHSDNDLLFGGPGQDHLSGGVNNDVVYGGADNDAVFGGDDDDRLFGGADDDALWGDNGIDTLHGGDGSDRLYGGAGESNIFGGAGDDRLIGGLDYDLLSGGSGDDYLESGAESDLLNGGEGKDTLFAGSGEDLLFGESGDDLLVGDGGQDTIEGGSGADQLFGGASADYLRGGAGDDSILGGEGKDKIAGGKGADAFIYEEATESRLYRDILPIDDPTGNSHVIKLYGDARNSGVTSEQSFSGVFSLSSVVTEINNIVVGLSVENITKQVFDFNFAIIQNHDGLDIIHNGDTIRIKSDYNHGDRLVIERNAENEIIYTRNDEEIFRSTSNLEINTPLFADASLEGLRGHVGDTVFHGTDGHQEPVRWTIDSAFGTFLQIGLMGDNLQTFISDIDDNGVVDFINTGDHWLLTTELGDERSRPDSDVHIATDANNSFLQKISGRIAWDSGASSIQTIQGSGSVTSEIVQNNSGAILGLSSVHRANNHDYIDFSIFQNDGVLEVYEYGRYVQSVGEYNVGDTLSIERTNDGSIRYIHNSSEVYVSDIVVAVDPPLFVDAAIMQRSGSIGSTTIKVNGENETPVVWRASEMYQAGKWGFDLETQFLDINNDGFLDALYSNGRGLAASRLALGDGSFGAVLKSSAPKEAGSITKTIATSGWDASAISAQQASGEVVLSATISEDTRAVWFGLTGVSRDMSKPTILEFGFVIAGDGRIYVFEQHDNRLKGPFGTISPGDRISIERDFEGRISYLINDEVAFVSEAIVESGRELVAKVVAHEPGSSIKNVQWTTADAQAATVQWIYDHGLSIGEWSGPLVTSFADVNDDSLVDLVYHDDDGFFGVRLGDGLGFFGEMERESYRSFESIEYIPYEGIRIYEYLGPEVDESDEIFDYNSGSDIIDISELNASIEDIILRRNAEKSVIYIPEIEFAVSLYDLKFNQIDFLVKCQHGDTIVETIEMVGAPKGGDDWPENESVLGNIHDNILYGLAGDDTIDGGLGDDFLFGGTGNDTLSYTSLEAEDPSSPEWGVRVSLGDQGSLLETRAGSDFAQGFENLIGTKFDDVLSGDSKANTLIGGSGRDTIAGAEGDDSISGGDGYDEAVFSGVFSRYQITDIGAQIQVRDDVGTDGTDTLTEIERIRFEDGLYFDGGFKPFTEIYVNSPEIMSPTPLVPFDPIRQFISSGSHGEMVAFSVQDADSALGDTLHFRLFGEDADKFDIHSETGTISLNEPLSDPFGSYDGDSIYELIVLVEDHLGMSDIVEVDYLLFVGG